MTFSNPADTMSSSINSDLSTIWSDYKQAQATEEEIAIQNFQIFNRGEIRGEKKAKQEMRDKLEKFVNSVLDDIRFVKKKINNTISELTTQGFQELKPYFEPTLQGVEGMTLRFILVVDSKSYRNEEMRSVMYDAFDICEELLPKHVSSSFSFVPDNGTLNRDRIILDGFQEL